MSLTAISSSQQYQEYHHSTEHGHQRRRSNVLDNIDGGGDCKDINDSSKNTNDGAARTSTTEEAAARTPTIEEAAARTSTTRKTTAIAPDPEFSHRERTDSRRWSRLWPLCHSVCHRALLWQQSEMLQVSYNHIKN